MLIWNEINRLWSNVYRIGKYEYRSDRWIREYVKRSIFNYERNFLK